MHPQPSMHLAVATGWTHSDKAQRQVGDGNVRQRSNIVSLLYCRLVVLECSLCVDDVGNGGDLEHLVSYGLLDTSDHGASDQHTPSLNPVTCLIFNCVLS